jgi:hypothetical protein
LRKRGLLDRVDFKGGIRSWKQYSDDELVEYAQKFIEENGIKSRKGLKRADGGLSFTLNRRNLIDKVFAIREQNEVAQGIQEISEAMGEFGGEA